MVAGLSNITPYTSGYFPLDKRNWWYDPITMTLGSMIGDIKSVLGIFDSPKPQTYVRVGVENMMMQKASYRWKIDYCNGLELGTTQPPVTEMSSDFSVPLETYPIENNFRHGSEEANNPPILPEDYEKMNSNGDFI